MLLGLLWGDDAALILSALEYLSPVLYTSLIFSVTLFLFFNLHSMKKVVNDIREKTIPYSSQKGISTILVLVICGYIYVSPLMFPPANAVHGFIPTKPDVIGHRCASSLGPENTLETAETALLFGIAGIEVDIQISIDGIPFLLHDDTLKRTTNVDVLFPERVNEKAANFLISEIRQLDAGTWFAETDPFGTIASTIISTTQAENYRDAQIPTLVEILNFVEQENLILNTDFKYPPIDHPFYETYLNICLSVIDEAEIDEQIWITQYDQESLHDIDSIFPDMQSVLSVGPNTAPGSLDFIDMEFDMINTHHGLANGLFLEYEYQGISVNTWTVNSILRFSQLWCLGVDFVTTDNPQDFHTLEYPYWFLEYPLYASAWFILDIVCMIFVGYRYRQFTPID
jgi:glycerophosphoryl diester phosphodiesterase